MAINKHSSDWLEIKKFTEERLAEMREANDSDLDSVETAELRGRIGFAKEILELEKEPEQKPRVVDTGYID